MSDYSLTLVLQIKTSKIINDMAKVNIKSEKISAFDGIFFVLDKFDRILSSVIDSHLGLRSRLIGYQSARLYGPSSPFSAVAATAWKTLRGKGVLAHGRSDYTLVWLKTDRHVSKDGKNRPLKIICGF